MEVMFKKAINLCANKNDPLKGKNDDGGSISLDDLPIIFFNRATKIVCCVVDRKRNDDS